MNILDLETNLDDGNYGEELLLQLQKLNEEFSTHAMSYTRATFLDGKKEMLEEIIQYIKKTL